MEQGSVNHFPATNQFAQWTLGQYRLGLKYRCTFLRDYGYVDARSMGVCNKIMALL